MLTEFEARGFIVGCRRRGRDLGAAWNIWIIIPSGGDGINAGDHHLLLLLRFFFLSELRECNVSGDQCDSFYETSIRKCTLAMRK
jgi:hypothetical protein